MEDDLDEPILNRSDSHTKRDARSVSTEERIRNLTHGQLYGVLCTQADNVPYGSVVAFAFSHDLSKFAFATATATRKYRLLSECRNVALVVSNQSEFPNDMMKIEAVTVTGKASEIESDATDSTMAGLLIARHPQLRRFIEAPTTSVFVVKVVRCFIVDSFQEVREWQPA
jgi:nitroimidazol reductase NimA-like FMN-containing flavoprotein (pyridoxamine 5'-phosphate oxidase superfamily)